MLLCCGVAVLSLGCAPKPGVDLTDGAFQRYTSHEPAAVAAATRAAFSKRGLRLIEDDKDGKKYRLEGSDSASTRWQVTIHEMDGMTRLAVRELPARDQVRSLAMIDTIMGHLSQ